MRLMFAAVLALGLVTAASAEEWRYEDGGVPIAYFDNGGAQFQFACRGGDLAMGFWVRGPHRAVAGATSMHLAIAADPAQGAELSAAMGASFAQDIPLIHSEGASMIIRGPIAQRWARIAQRAKGSIRVAYVRVSGGFEVFDSNDFGAKGSSSAIKQVLDRCG